MTSTENMDPETTPAPVAADLPEEPARRRPLRRWLVPGLLALVLAGLLVAIVVVGRSRDHAVDPAALVVAQQETENFFGLDYRHADRDVDAVLALATGTFKEQYAAQRQAIVSGVTEKKLVVTATVPSDGVALEFYDRDRAQVLVAVDVHTSAAGTDEETLNRYRARIVLDRVAGHWLVSAVNQVGGV